MVYYTVTKQEEKNVKKKIALLLTLVLALAACQAQALTLAGLERSENNIWSENAFFDAVQDATGVALSIEECHDEQAWTAQKQAWLRGEGEMPDMLFKAHLSTLEEQELLDAGVLVDLAPYLEEYAPNLWKIFQARPEWLADVALPDGRIASLPALSGAERECVLWMNTAFLDALGLSTPNNIDEFTDMLRAMKNGDPNGNGKKDETPLNLCGPWEAKFLLHAFGIVADDYNLYMDENGKACFAPQQEEYRAFVEWLKMALDEGLISSDAFRTTQTARETASQLTNSSSSSSSSSKTPQTVGALISIAPYMQVRSTDTTNYTAITPLEANGRRAFRELIPAVSRGTFAVTSACTDIAEALKFVDYLYTEEGGRLINAGREGVDYSLQPDGSWKWNVDSDYTALSELLTRSVIGGDGVTPGLEPAAFERNSEIAADNYSRRQIDAIRQYLVAPMPLTRAQSAADETRIAELQAALGTCVDTAIANFAMGITPLDDENWEAFQQQLRDEGVEEFLALWQAKLDAR